MIDIRPATTSAVTWIACNMRERDHAEVMCQVGAENPTYAGVISIRSALCCWVAYYRGEPVSAFGIGHSDIVNPNVGQVWLFGTGRMWRSIPAVSRFCLDRFPGICDGAGITRLECRADEGHDIAHRWIERLNGSYVCDLRNWGKDGQTFKLYEWVTE